MTKRCEWAQGQSESYVAYHDDEWGVPVYDDRLLFEFLILEGAQAGLSWATILNKRGNYKRLFAGFDPVKVARFSDQKLEKILLDAGIVRNRLKVYSVRNNAQAFLRVVEEYGDFARYIWEFVGGRPQINRYQSLKDIPAKTAESDAMCKDLKKRGFKFIGSTICYAFMQATGMVNDHTVDCFRYKPCCVMAKNG